MRAEAILARQLHGSQRQGVKAGDGVYYTAGAAMKKFVLVMPLLALAVAMSCVTVKSSDSGAEGDEKIKDTIEDTRKKEAQARKEQRERRKQEEAQEERWRQDPGEDNRDYRRSDDREEGEGFVWLEYATAVRFAAYPYAPSSPYAFSTSTSVHPEQTKFYALQVESSAAYHFDGTYENLNRLTFQLTAFHFNLVQQSFFAASERFSLLSINAGCSLALPDFLLNGYAGAYWLDFLDRPLPSFGISSQLFLPGGFYLDLYNLNAVLESLWIMHLTGSLNFSVWRFGLAVGYTYNNFAGNVYQGPSLGISFWL
jgi:hypothetical protein